jgi:uncharacterized membrane protein
VYALLYPAIVGAGLATLLGHYALTRDDPYNVERLALGGMTVAIYSASFLSLDDNDPYPPWALLLDICEVGIIFCCFWALGLLDIMNRDDLHYLRFASLLALDLLIVQSMWRAVVTPNFLKTNGAVQALVPSRDPKQTYLRTLKTIAVLVLFLRYFLIAVHPSIGDKPRLYATGSALVVAIAVLALLYLHEAGSSSNITAMAENYIAFASAFTLLAIEGYYVWLLMLR